MPPRIAENHLGYGMDTLSGIFTGVLKPKKKALRGTITEPSLDDGFAQSIVITHFESIDELEQSYKTSYSINGSGTYSGVTLSADMSLERAFSSKESSKTIFVSVIATARSGLYKFVGVDLESDPADLIKSHDAYGDSYIDSLEVGGHLRYTYRFEAKTIEERSSLSEAVDLAVSYAGGNANARMAADAKFHSLHHTEFTETRIETTLPIPFKGSTIMDAIDYALNLRDRLTENADYASVVQYSVKGYWETGNAGLSLAGYHGLFIDACHQARDLRNLKYRLSATEKRIQFIADRYDADLIKWLQIQPSQWERRDNVGVTLQRLNDCIDFFIADPFHFKIDDNFNNDIRSAQDLVTFWRISAIEDVVRTMRVQIGNNTGRRISPAISNQWALSYDAPITSLSITTGLNPPADKLLCFGYSIMESYDRPIFDTPATGECGKPAAPKRPEHSGPPTGLAALQVNLNGIAANFYNVSVVIKRAGDNLEIPISGVDFVRVDSAHSKGIVGLKVKLSVARDVSLDVGAVECSAG